MKRLAVAAFLLLTAARCGSTAHAQADDALELAMISVHEGGWSATAEPAAIYAVAVTQGARTGMTWQRWLRVHSRRFATRRVARQWIYRLDREGSDPHAGIAWARHRDRWLAMVAAADAAIAAPPVCEARTWGDDADRDRVIRLGLPLVEVDCGTGTKRTENHFFARRAQ